MLYTIKIHQKVKYGIVRFSQKEASVFLNW